MPQPHMILKPLQDPRLGAVDDDADDSDILRAMHAMMRETQRSRRVVITNVIIALWVWTALTIGGVVWAVHSIVDAYENSGGGLGY